jgi:hypothetical protein
MTPEELLQDPSRTALAMIRAVAHEDREAFLLLWNNAARPGEVLLALASVPVSMTFAICEMTGHDPYEGLDETLRMLASA